MANIRITSLPLLTDPLISDSFVPSSSEFVVEESGVSYKITAAGILENSSTATANLGNTTITGNFNAQALTTLTGTLDITTGVDDSDPLNPLPVGSVLSLNSNQSGAPTLDASFSVNRGSETTASLTWDETNNRWDFGGFPVKAQTFITQDGEFEVEYALETIQIEAGDGLAGGGSLTSDVGIQVAPNGIENIMLRDSAGISVIGRAVDSVGDPADIAADTQTPDTVLRYDGSELGFGKIENNMIPNNTINGSKLQDNSVTSAELASDSVGASELANNSVSSANIINGSIVGSDLAANTVGSREIEDNVSIPTLFAQTTLVIPIK